MAKRMGRPRLENANNIKLSIRINADIAARLDAYSKAANISKGAIIRAGIERILQEAAEKQK